MFIEKKKIIEIFDTKPSQEPFSFPKNLNLIQVNYQPLQFRQSNNNNNNNNN